MTSEKSLSDKIFQFHKGKYEPAYAKEEDVKEAVKRLKEKIKEEHEDSVNNWGADLIAFEWIDEIFGKRLVE